MSRRCSFEGGLQRGHGLLVKTKDQFLGGRRAEDFVEEDLQVRVRHGLQAQRGLAHFADPLAQRGGVFGAEMRVEAEGHLEFIDGLGGDARGENLVQALERVMVALEPADAFLDREAGLRGLGHRANSGQGGQVAIRCGTCSSTSWCSSAIVAPSRRGVQSAQIRNPKPETRRKAEIRGPNQTAKTRRREGRSEMRPPFWLRAFASSLFDFDLSGFELRISFGFRVSGFGLLLRLRLVGIVAHGNQGLKTHGFNLTLGQRTQGPRRREAVRSEADIRE